ncbi:MAG TPA: hypothetical protein VIY49_14395 [Bryobacteraceae bacterium]
MSAIVARRPEAYRALRGTILFALPGIRTYLPAPARLLNGVAHKSRELELPMHELTVRKRGKQRQDDA